MNPRDSLDNEDEVEFFDAFDSLSNPYAADDDDGTLSDSAPPPLLESVPIPASPPPTPAIRRRRTRRHPVPPSPRRTTSASKDPSLDSPTERRREILLALKAQELDSNSPSTSALTSDRGGDRRPEVSSQSVATSVRGDSGLEAIDTALVPPRSCLEYVADFVIRAVFFQITLLINFIKLPFWLLYYSFLLVADPFGTLRRATGAAKVRFTGAFKGLFGKVLPSAFERVTGHQEAGKLVARLAWGCFWSLYVCFMLFGLLTVSFLGGGLIVRRVVEEPVHMTEELSFDYTKASPQALVPIPSYGGCSVSGEKFDVTTTSQNVWRLVPPNQKLQLTISLTLPESNYNRNLGVFQVRVELLTLNGNVTTSSSQPCILRFKSSHIRLVETFLKSMLLLAGYSSESQVLRLRMRGLREGTKPTVCIRVILEQRAEFKPGAGIPEIYAASMKLESELPLLKRMIWNWRMTVFIWTSMVLFIMQLLIVLVCCRPVIVPGARLGGGSSRTP
ncbi:seipin-2-like isoform X1 [Canna indica]|uniref:Seipin-2-like isoform X1 n=1 Tax=Canna indica TaxID=4628 RepID=A0AAQ3JMV5_9LILI|nr:seipin-2-like isoform X1 [Canna indica]